MIVTSPSAVRALCWGLAISVSGLTLTGCAGGGITYGTGTPTSLQTITDVSGMISLRGNDRPDIDYRPRPGLVTPPSNNLPPPGSNDVAASTNWPNDPDVQARRQREANARREATMSEQDLARRDPGFRLPRNAEAQPNEERGNPDFKPDDAGSQRLASIRGDRGGSHDAEGRPVRRYLTDPPAEFRQPDPNAPTDAMVPGKPRGKFSLRNLWPF